jgi:hypothetical protein
VLPPRENRNEDAAEEPEDADDVELRTLEALPGVDVE